MDSISNIFFNLLQKIRRLSMRNPFENFFLEEALRGCMGCWGIIDDLLNYKITIFDHFDEQINFGINSIKNIRIYGNIYKISDIQDDNNEKIIEIAKCDKSSEENNPTATSDFLSSLQKIRNISEKNLKDITEKAFEAFVIFLYGENFGREIEEWEKTTGLIFREHYGEKIYAHEKRFISFEDEQRSNEDKARFLSLPQNVIIGKPDYFMDEFNEFVHSYYDCANDKISATILISKMIKSKEETFAKYFELLDIFIKQKNDFFADLNK